MVETPTLVVRFKDVEHDELVREEIERRTRQIAKEFPETTRFEISKSTEVATHGDGPDLRTATDQLFHRVKHQLRRVHDKRIFQHRRAAQKASPKR
jgi:ribosome-associated translation inhibitor RaiA